MQEYTIVELTPEIVSTTRRKHSYWRGVFDRIPKGKALEFTCNNRQRAHQVKGLIQTSARYHKVSVCTRVIHGTLEIHGTDKWLVYLFLREDKEVNDATHDIQVS